MLHGLLQRSLPKTLDVITFIVFVALNSPLRHSKCNLTIYCVGLYSESGKVRNLNFEQHKRKCVTDLLLNFHSNCCNKRSNDAS